MGYTIKPNRFYNGRHIHIAQIVDKYVIKGAFKDTKNEGLSQVVHSFCDQLLTVLEMSKTRRSQSIKLINFPIGYDYQYTVRHLLFDRHELGEMVHEIEVELSSISSDNEYEVIPLDEVLAWRIALMTSLYYYNGLLMPVNARDVSREVVPVCHSILSTEYINDNITPYLLPSQTLSKVKVRSIHRTINEAA
jgi:hypothetical protein